MKKNGCLRRQLLLAALLLISFCSGAQPRSEAGALQVARSFFEQSPRKARAPRIVAVNEQYAGAMSRHKMDSQVGKVGEEVGFYLFNDEANGRFVIVSGDERQTDILGYSDEGQFDPDDVPCGLETFLAQYSHEYEQLQSDGGAYVRPAKVSTTAVGPLIQTKWGQSNYYNRECPMDPSTNKQCVTGCVATAMAQIMKYYGYPAKGQGSNSYTSSKNAIYQKMDFSTVTFNWSQMTNTYSSSSSSTACNAVSLLMHACGVSVNMDYGSSGSGTHIYNAPYALIHYFKYNPNTRYYDRKYYNDDEWDKIVQTELANGRPILYKGSSEPDSEGNRSAHAFVLDGCDTQGAYHFNWGWSGSGNGYFVLTSLRPKTSSKQYNYSELQAMVGQIDTRTAGTREDPWYADKFEFNTSNLQVTFTNFWCFGSEATYYKGGWNGYRGWELKNIATGNSVYGLYEVNGTLCNHGKKEWSCTIGQNQLADGASYYLYPVITDKDKSRVTRVRTLGGKTDYYLVQVKNGKIQSTVKGDVNGASTPVLSFVSMSSDNSNPDKLSPMDALSLRGTFKNTGKTDNVKIRLRIWDENMNGIAYSDAVTKTFSKNSETTVQMDYSLENIPEGKYFASLQFLQSWGDNKWHYSDKYLVSFSVKVASTPVMQFVSVTSDNPDLQNLYTKDKLVFKGILLNKGKTADIKTRFRIWNEDMEAVAASDPVTVHFQQGKQTTVTFEYPLAGFAEGNYIATIQYLNSWDDNKWYYNKSQLVSFVINPPTTPEMWFVAVSSDNPDLNKLSRKDNLVLRLTFNNRGKAADIKTRLRIWDMDMQGIAASEGVSHNFPRDEQTTVRMEYSLSNIPPGKYYATVQYLSSWDDNKWYYSDKYRVQLTVLSDALDVQGVRVENEASQPVYDLNGRRLTKPRKGINVIGGKKVVVR